MIQFQNKNARLQLITLGIVHTVRNYRRSFGTHEAYYYRNGNRVSLGNVDVYLAERIHGDKINLNNINERIYEDALLKYISSSGFIYVSEWIKAIKQFNRGELPESAIVLKVEKFLI